MDFVPWLWYTANNQGTEKEWLKSKGGDKMALTNEDLQAIASLLQPIHTRLDNMDTRFDNMETRLDSMENRFDKIESEVSALKVGQREFNKELRRIKDKVSNTYDLALEVWGQSTENRTWLEESQKAIS